MMQRGAMGILGRRPLIAKQPPHPPAGGGGRPAAVLLLSTPRFAPGRVPPFAGVRQRVAMCLLAAAQTASGLLNMQAGTSALKVQLLSVALNIPMRTALALHWSLPDFGCETPALHPKPGQSISVVRNACYTTRRPAASQELKAPVY